MGLRSVRIRFAQSRASKVSVRPARDPVSISSLERSSAASTLAAPPSPIPDGVPGGGRTGLRWRATKAKQRLIGKVNRKERAANIRTRNNLARELERDLDAILEDFGIRGLNRTRFGQLFRSGGNIGIVNNPATGFSILEGRLGAAISTRMMQAVREGVQIGSNFSSIPGLVIDQQRVNEAALSYLNRPSTQDVIEGIKANTRGGVQEKVKDMLTGGISPERAAVEIGDAVGLTRHQSKQIANFRRRITGQRIPIEAADTPLVRAAIDRDVRNFTRRLQRNRGQAIAQSEMQSAIQAGEQAFWQQASDSGQVDLEKVVKTWFTVDDGNVCPICEPLHGMTIRFNEAFDGQYTAPPAHINCRCYLEMMAAETR